MDFCEHELLECVKLQIFQLKVGTEKVDKLNLKRGYDQNQKLKLTKMNYTI